MVTKSSFDIKSSQLRHTTIRLNNPDLDLFFTQMSTIALKAPKLFANAAIALDFSLIQSHLFHANELEILREGFLKQGAHLIGIENAASNQKNSIIKANIPLIPHQTQLPQKQNQSQNTTLTLERVRSGSTISSQGDIVVLGDCAYGSVLNAESNIYIYGKLEGQAHFAINNPKAHLICKYFNPELISISGTTFTQEQIPTEFRKKHIICTLSENHSALKIKSIDHQAGQEMIF